MSEVINIDSIIERLLEGKLFVRIMEILCASDGIWPKAYIFLHRCAWTNNYIFFSLSRQVLLIEMCLLAYKNAYCLRKGSKYFRKTILLNKKCGNRAIKFPCNRNGAAFFFIIF